MQASAGSLGGYVAGRLRTTWVNVHTDEVYFRDTAHGFLVWAVAVVISAGLLATAATSLVGAGARAAATAATGAGVAAATGATEVPGVAFYVDTLFRTDRPRGDGSDASTRAEAGRIVAAALGRTDIAPADKTYLSQLVAAATGLSQVDAAKRIDDTLAQARATLAEAEGKARAAADATRKAGAYLSLWMFVSLLASALCASYAATIGGRQRDAILV